MVQIVETTDEQKIAMYIKCTKIELIKMLIEANKHLDRLTKDLKLTYVVDTSSLEYLNDKDFGYNLMTALIDYFDMFKTEEDDGIAVALTNYKSGLPLHDCGKFYLNSDNTYNFKLY